jgi:hypothetical protein
MKKIICWLLAAHAGLACAEWQLVHTDADKSQFFIDPSNVSLVDGYKRAWVLNNLPQANSQGTRSFRSVEEFDCVKESGRVMQITAYDGDMASGNVLARRHGNGQWTATEPGSVDRLLLQAACAGKP